MSLKLGSWSSTGSSKARISSKPRRRARCCHVSGSEKEARARCVGLKDAFFAMVNVSVVNSCLACVFLKSDGDTPQKGSNPLITES